MTNTVESIYGRPQQGHRTGLASTISNGVVPSLNVYRGAPTRQPYDIDSQRPISQSNRMTSYSRILKIRTPRKHAPNGQHARAINQRSGEPSPNLPRQSDSQSVPSLTHPWLTIPGIPQQGRLMEPAVAINSSPIPSLNIHRGALLRPLDDGQANHQLKSQESQRNNLPQANERSNDELAAPPCINKDDAALEPSAQLPLDHQDRSARSSRSQTASGQRIQKGCFRTEHRFNAPQFMTEQQFNAPKVMTHHCFKKEGKGHPSPEFITSFNALPFKDLDSLRFDPYPDEDLDSLITSPGKVNESECDSWTTFASAQDTTRPAELTTPLSANPSTAVPHGSSESDSANKEATIRASPSDPTAARQKSKVPSEPNRARLTTEAEATLIVPSETTQILPANHAMEPTFRGAEALPTIDPPTSSAASQRIDPIGPRKTSATAALATIPLVPTRSLQFQSTPIVGTLQSVSADSSKETTPEATTQPVHPKPSVFCPAAARLENRDLSAPNNPHTLGGGIDVVHCQAIPSGPRGGEDSPTTKTTLRINTESTHHETIQRIVNSFKCAIKDQITDISPVIATAYPHHKLLNSRKSMLPNHVLDKLRYDPLDTVSTCMHIPTTRNARSSLRGAKSMLGLLEANANTCSNRTVTPTFGLTAKIKN